MKYIYTYLEWSNREAFLVQEGKKQAIEMYVDTNQIDKNQFNKLLQFDFTRGKLIQQITKWYIQDSTSIIKFIKRLSPSFKIFQSVYNKKSIKDLSKNIYDYKTSDEFISKLENFQRTYDYMSLGKGALPKLDKDFEILQNDQRITVINIKTHLASMYFGHDSGWKGNGQWCVSYKSPDFFNSYRSRRALLYLIVDKTKINTQHHKHLLSMYPQLKSYELAMRGNKHISNDWKAYLTKLGVNKSILKHDLKIDWTGYSPREISIFNALALIPENISKNGDDYVIDTESTFTGQQLDAAQEHLDPSIKLIFNKDVGIENLDKPLTSYDFFKYAEFKDIDLESNNITTLEGLPKSIGGSLFLTSNNITSLKGLPKTIDGCLGLSGNKITSLEGLPKTISGNLDLASNNITSLRGLSENIAGSLDLSRNQITSLKGLPQKLSGYLSLSWNNITSCEGLPKTIGRDLYLANNNITSCEGLPKTIGRDLYLSGNKNISLEGLPENMRSKVKL